MPAPSRRQKSAARVRGGFPWRVLRITILGFILALTGLGAWLAKARTASWQKPLWVAIYPIDADGSTATAGYLASLGGEAFSPIDAFFAREGARHRLALSGPVETHLYAPINELPPQLAPGSGILGTMVWSLKLRYWAWHVTHGRDEATPDVQIFVLYHDPERTESVPHSLGLEKGMLGVVYAFAARRADGPNDIVIAHELMHTLGAKDKYDPASDEPTYPEGYADPDQQPLLPQHRAEIMAGRMTLSKTDWEMPESLGAVVVGPQTAREIHWEDR